MVQTEPFALLVNPRAGAGRAESLIPVLEAALREAGATFTTLITKEPRDATRLVREALASGLAGVAVVGGDGTTNEALNGFFYEDGSVVREGAWIGTLPCGTGGDFRKTLGIGDDVGAMVTRMLWAEPRPIDCGRLTFQTHEGKTATRAFLNITSFGMGGLVDQLVNDGPKWIGGRAAFLWGSLRALAKFRPKRVRIHIDDAAPRESTIFNVAVANGRYFGGGMHIAPDAKIDDGLFDVVGLEGDSPVVTLSLTPHIYRGTHIGRPHVTHTRARRVVAEPVNSTDRVLLDVDGEAPGMLPCTFEVISGVIRLKA